MGDHDSYSDVGFRAPSSGVPGSPEAWSTNRSNSASEKNVVARPEERCSTRPMKRRLPPPARARCATNARWIERLPR